MGGNRRDALCAHVHTHMHMHTLQHMQLQTMSNMVGDLCPLFSPLETGAAFLTLERMHLRGKCSFHAHLCL